MINIYTDNTNKIVFWYTPKCGCTFIRKLYAYLTNSLLVPKTFETIIDNFDKYKHILFTRNIYKRLVSGYLDCYVQNKKYPSSKTFLETIQSLNTSGFDEVNELHFQHQLSRNYNSHVVFDRIYDVENIDYKYISDLFKMPINDNIIKCFRISAHHVKYNTNYVPENDTKNPENNTKSVWNMTPTELNALEGGYPPYKYFYNDEIISMIQNFYSADFMFFGSLVGRL